MPIILGSGIAISGGMQIGGTPNLGCFVPGSCPVGPGTPLIGTAYVTGVTGTTASVTYSAPLSNGGNVIVRYMTTSSPGGVTGNLYQSGSGNIAVSGLTAGTTYTFTVQAVNAYGTSTPSLPSNSITEWTVPGAPTIGTATATGATTATVAFTAPSSNGGQAITIYTATSTPGGITGTLSQAGSGTITVSGLTTTTSYTFTVKATNSVGASTASAASNQITTWGVPAAPTGITASRSGSTAASVSFSAPANNGSAITGYTVTSSPGGITGTGSSSPITVSGLTAATTYTFTVTATNSLGTGPSSVSNSMSTPAPAGSQSYTTAGTYTFHPPAGVCSISAVVVGGGAGGARAFVGSVSNIRGGAGGGLAYKNNVTVVPVTGGYNVTVGGVGNGINTLCGFLCYATTAASIKGGCSSIVLPGGTLKATGGTFGPNSNYGCSTGGYPCGYYDGGGTGGRGGTGSNYAYGAGGGGGAGGYAGNGGAGNYARASSGNCPPAACQSRNGFAGSGGGGGGAGATVRCGNSYGSTNAGGGGGVGVFGQGSNGTAGTSSGYWVGGPGSSGSGQTYGGGGRILYVANTYCGSATNGGGGAVRIVWPGCARSFPSTCVGTP